jgi:hypothetical protein
MSAWRPSVLDNAVRQSLTGWQQTALRTGGVLPLCSMAPRTRAWITILLGVLLQRWALQFIISTQQTVAVCTSS